jgi:hypothetical protein
VFAVIVINIEFPIPAIKTPAINKRKIFCLLEFKSAPIEKIPMDIDSQKAF